MINIPNSVHQQLIEKAGNKTLAKLNVIALKLSLSYIKKIYTFDYDETTRELLQSKNPLTDEDEIDSFYHQIERAIDNNHIQINLLIVSEKQIMMNIKLVSTEEHFHLQVKKEDIHLVHLFEYIEERMKIQHIFQYLE